MFKIVRKSVQFGASEIILETGRMARQADGAVLVTYGETMVLVCATADKTVRPGADFFPLGVHYQERSWAAGRIPGGFIKRETRPSEKEILTSRLIDRPLRPLFPKGYTLDTQVVATVISYDGVHQPDIPAMIGASAALAISGLPFDGPIGGARVAHIDGQLVLNPSVEQMASSRLDLVVAGTDKAVTMVESEVDFLSEEEMLDAVMFGFEGFQPVVTLIRELAAECAKPRMAVEAPVVDAALQEQVRQGYLEEIRAGYQVVEKLARQNAVGECRKRAIAALSAENSALAAEVASIFSHLEAEVIRERILSTGTRIDGRGLTDVRQIVSEVSLLPRVHGSALFTRGETQALAVVTLGTGRDEQIVESLDGESRDAFYLNYTFPPYSVGETGRMGAPGRREIGHGKLATRAVAAILPEKDSFPYTVRAISEITESNGSSSMATVCGVVLAMMDAGVPIKAPVAGIAMGLVKEGERFAVLSDIMGDEDHFGDMDFKVAGNAQGITALQMDIKITGINREIMAVALRQARAGRIHILERMQSTLAEPRADLSNYAPRIFTMKINPDKIREVIGSGGKVIRGITEETGCQIDITDDGTITIAAVDGQSAKAAETIIRRIVEEVEAGQVYEGKVVRVTDFGAFVNILPNKDGLVHISQLSGQRVAKVTDVVKEGDVVKVKVLDVDRQGRIKLTMKDV
ncbi:polyribonucleotide nucleotidyltransferase [Candidatus Magnetaquicoccus inordinatus]|uniref:polyribonucleotide nucleotidyltransferase n=1 Tax=Candidatus Magnetaquicoccus inordinatus TaxID=2496818 RepID=UPI00102C51FB|nr:polyribonucleotide nucleotidyltransferase [Candidatus Magnetaquicoccus inordinatus]